MRIFTIPIYEIEIDANTLLDTSYNYLGALSDLFNYLYTLPNSFSITMYFIFG